MYKQFVENGMPGVHWSFYIYIKCIVGKRCKLLKMRFLKGLAFVSGLSQITVSITFLRKDTYNVLIYDEPNLHIHPQPPILIL